MRLSAGRKTRTPSIDRVVWKRSKPRMNTSRSLREPPLLPAAAPGIRSSAWSTLALSNLRRVSPDTVLPPTASPAALRAVTCTSPSA
jgi:hypothetical protein